jgi:hypothetical protein
MYDFFLQCEGENAKEFVTKNNGFMSQTFRIMNYSCTIVQLSLFATHIFLSISICINLEIIDALQDDIKRQ